MKLISKFDVSVFRFLFFFLFFVKSGLFFYWKMRGNVISGSDADYYEYYALGMADFSTSAWPDFLRLLNSFSFFDRIYIAFFLYFLVSLVIPFLFGRVVELYFYARDPKIFWVSSFCVSLYPSLNFVGLDIFRDSVMVVFFLLSVFFYFSFMRRPAFFNLLFFLLAVYFCFVLRGYLGVAIFISFVLVFVFGFFPLVKFKYIFLSHVVVLFVANYYGLLSPFHAYREADAFQEAGSSLGVILEGSGFFFIPYYIYSFFAQVFGVFFSGYKSVLAFFLESTFFMFIFWRCRNMSFSDVGAAGFFLLIFSLVYASVFVLANDNLGTALRLRIYIYLSIAVVYLGGLRLQRGSHEAH